MHILHFISHTHWDREWHEPFQIFRIRLAQTINKALDILANDPDYKHFMLDGQTIVLEDYFEIQPEREAELKAHIQSGRILIGPWYVLPDEFLVSGESIIRNLQRGIRIANSFGRCMMIGYIPDPFGHISQMPQILSGFGIDTAMFRRGLADESTELWWEGADGTRVLTTYLRDGYDNAAWLSREPVQFAEGVTRLLKSILPYAVTENVLMMHGTDHMQPWDNLPQVMREAEKMIPDVRLIHSNLPEYEKAVQRSLSDDGRERLIVMMGELRNSKRHHLLPGVTSTRMWIKQRNARAQVLLERWAEPLAAVAIHLLDEQDGVRGELHHELLLGWKYLLQNHPHDSICGCSADQVHLEMAPRFDSVDQIGNNIVERSQEIVLHSINTEHAALHAVPIVVFNPVSGPRTDQVRLQVDLPSALGDYQVSDQDGLVMPSYELGRHVDEYARVTATADDLRWMFGGMKSGEVDGHKLRAIDFQVNGGQVQMHVAVSDQGEPNTSLVESKLAELDGYVADPELKTFQVQVVSPQRIELAFLARDVPGYGFKTFWLTDGSDSAIAQKQANPELLQIENDFLSVVPNELDGTVTITDKLTRAVLDGANRFVDGGDFGDLYDYCPPPHDDPVSVPSLPPKIELVERNPLRQVLRVRSSLQVPASLAPDRQSRSQELVDLPFVTEITLAAGVPRVEFRTEVSNQACDHRLRVEFPTAIHADQSIAEQAFDVVTRDIDLPAASSDWVEKPAPTKPMQGWVAVEDDRIGLMLASRGLPEYEVRRDYQEGPVTMVLTLLRCIGWLSRPDLSCRRGDAGPEKQTPGAQELGTHTFEYALIPFGNGSIVPRGGELRGNAIDWNRAYKEALAFNAPLRGAATSKHSGLLPSEASWIEVSPPEFTLTAIKPPEEGEGLVIRGFNSSSRTIDVRLALTLEFEKAKRVNLNEESLETLASGRGRTIDFTVKPREIVTVRFER